MTVQTDGEDVLLTRVRAGDLDAFETLMNLHVRRLRAFISVKAPAAHLIDEIAQETFIFAFRHIHEFKEGNFGAWLRAIAFNMLRADFKRVSRREEHTRKYAETLLMGECIETEMSDAPEMMHLAACLELLTERTRQLVAWRYRDRKSFELIAQTLGQAAAAVRATLFRARRQLRDCILQRLRSEGI